MDSDWHQFISVSASYMPAYRLVFICLFIKWYLTGGSISNLDFEHYDRVPEVKLGG